ncbi:hypothetical protein EXIGLDRAFT_768927 [Exidia glandulosa HHB12029]|uniref:Glycosyltransferase family 32 protein n=1 Tax=Exidia glandulosa HHB12029 TaxID=1314781 RepID=A0A165HUL0_EXIGL|nr:hypothetical protein EXIGLDRAFT_768927 [Exidia glandulosa HHB12029]
MTARLGNGLSKEKGRISPLPSYALDRSRAYGEPWTTSVYLPVPPIRGRRLRIVLPVPPRIYRASVTRFGRKRGSAVFAVGLVFVLYLLLTIARGIRGRSRSWSDGIWQDPPTLVFDRPELERIWQWEITAGHYPSTRLIPEEIGLAETPLNPGLPRRSSANEYPPQRAVNTSGARVPTAIQNTVGTGSRRIYLDIASEPPRTAYPPRPVPGSVADLDIIMDNCDFNENKYVRDCLEVLRVGGGLDNEKRVRRGNTDDWKYIYLEQPAEDTTPVSTRRIDRSPDLGSSPHADPSLVPKPGPPELPLRLPKPEAALPYHELSSPCDPDYPRTFHMFWAGPFTDKPYMAILSYLYTQNLGLHLEKAPDNICRPQFWLWINPGPASAVPNPSAYNDMMASLEANPWSKPFLHPRFHDVVQFKLWNTTEQLDGVPEIKNEWRKYEDALFNSGGHVLKAPKKKSTTTTTESDVDSEKAATKDQAPSPTNGGEAAAAEDDLFQRTGSTSQSTYDRMSVILSDMARFVLCHRFGGTYLDADTLLMRDWEELWGWRGAFAYRWSRLPKYNTAVLRMNKGSALGSFLFRTALRNGLDFHPMTVSRYTRDAFLEGLLLRLPDALFDSAWLNTEYYQLDRPAFPYLGSFQEFFDTPPQHAAAPQQLGFEGFFRGAYAYHWHNFWWKAFDPTRNWPDLGQRFIECEKKQRALLHEAQIAEQVRLEAAQKALQHNGKHAPSPSPSPVRAAYEEHLEMKDAEDVSSDKRDLAWATVMKRTFEAYIRGEQPNMYGEWILFPS